MGQSLSSRTSLDVLKWSAAPRRFRPRSEIANASEARRGRREAAQRDCECKRSAARAQREDRRGAADHFKDHIGLYTPISGWHKPALHREYSSVIPACRLRGTHAAQAVIVMGEAMSRFRAWGLAAALAAGVTAPAVAADP